jgi:hypothetical protein
MKRHGIPLALRPASTSRRLAELDEDVEATCELINYERRGSFNSWRILLTYSSREDG